MIESGQQTLVTDAVKDRTALLPSTDEQRGSTNLQGSAAADGQQLPAMPTTLHALLSKLDLHSADTTIARPAGVVLELTLRYLSELHQSQTSVEQPILAAAHRHALLERAYANLIDGLPAQLRHQAQHFMEAQMEEEQDVVHGALWARNIVVSAIRTDEISVAEGELYWGDGTYDLACIASDYAVPLVRSGGPLEPLSNLIWYRYRGLRRGQRCGTERSFRVHLALQLMRKTLGFESTPGPLNRGDVIRGRVLYTNELIRWLR